MLQRVKKEQLRVGMFVEAVEGIWEDGPFQRRRFILIDREQVEHLNKSNISGVFINTALGCGLDDATPVAEISRRDAEEVKSAKAAERALSESTEQLQSMFDSIGMSGEVNLSVVGPVVDQLADSMQRNHRLFIDMTRLKTKDTGTFHHSIAVCALLIHFARYLKLDDQTVKTLGFAGLVHDVGKLAVPAQVLNKQGALTPEERALIETHPIAGYNLLRQHSGISPIVLDVCRHHHERIDGRGYPDQLRPPQLSVFARMSAICDVYDAVTSLRPYKKPWTPDVARSWMLQRLEHFDQKLLVKFFLSIV